MMGIELQKTQFDPVWQFLCQIDMDRHEVPTVAEVIARRALQEQDRLGYLRALAEPGQRGDPHLIDARRYVASTLLKRLEGGEQL